MVVSLELDYLLPPSISARQAQRGVHGFRTGVVKPHHLGARHVLADLFCDLDLEFMLSTVDQPTVKLLLDCLNDWGWSVTEDERAHGEHIVDVLIAVNIPHVRPAGMVEEYRKRLFGEADVAADTARQILEKAKAAGCEVILPTDAVVAADLAPGVATRTVELTQAGALGDEDKIFDVGPKTLAQILQAISHSATLVWNGPLGVFEVQPFDRATVEAAQHAAQLAKSGKLVAVAGGGDTVAALNAAGVSGDFTFVSTAGGAFLEWMEGKALPGVAALAQ